VGLNGDIPLIGLYTERCCQETGTRRRKLEMRENTGITTNPRNQKEEIHPVTAVIIMVAITVLLAAFLYEYNDMGHHHELTPWAGATTSGNATTNYTMTIIDIDTEATLNKTEYYLKDAGGVAVPGAQGTVPDINGLNISDANVNLSFTDKDADGMLSSEDYFEVVSQKNGGPAATGYSLRIAYSVTGGTIVERSF